MSELQEVNHNICEECLIKYLGDDKYICDLIRASKCQYKALGLIGTDNETAKTCLNNSMMIIDTLVQKICEERNGKDNNENTG